MVLYFNQTCKLNTFYIIGCDYYLPNQITLLMKYIILKANHSVRIGWFRFDWSLNLNKSLKN